MEYGKSPGPDKQEPEIQHGHSLNWEALGESLPSEASGTSYREREKYVTILGLQSPTSPNTLFPVNNKTKN